MAFFRERFAAVPEMDEEPDKPSAFISMRISSGPLSPTPAEGLKSCAPSNLGLGSSGFFFMLLLLLLLRFLDHCVVIRS